MAKNRLTGLKTVFFVFVVFGLSNNLTEAISRPTDIVLENNEYKHILVAINDNVAEDAALLQHIKDAFTKGSAFLYSATNQRAVFHDVTILVPASWASHGSYAAATTQVFNNADVIFSAPISPDPLPAAPAPDAPPSDSGDGGFLDAPWIFQHVQPAMTKTYAGCGQPGIRIVLTTDIFNPRNMGSLGPAEKILVHEWAHFRWGVFDEYALEGEPQFYFSPSTGRLEGIRCTEKQQGIITRVVDPVTGRFEYCRDLDPNTGLYPEGCRFQPYPAGPQTNGVEASIMDRVNVRPIIKFCNDDETNNSTKHNYDAPSRHNRLCGHRSAWDVLTTSQDFANGANSPRAGVDPAPVFNVVQAHAARRMILALDTSASMAEDDKLTRMKQAVGTFINEGVAPDTVMGLTTFSGGSSVQRALTTLNTTKERQALVDDLPDSQSGATDLSAGLTAAAQLLQSAQATPTTDASLSPSRHARSSQLTSLPASGGHVVMVTDGQGTSGPDVMSVLPRLKEQGAIVTVVVLGGPPSEELEQLARETGGRVYCDNNYGSSTAAMDAFFDIADTCRSRLSPVPVQILSQAERLEPKHTSRRFFYLDSDLGNSTTVLVSYDDSVPAVNVTSPSGRVYNHAYPEYSVNHRLKMAKIIIPGTAESGKWTYSIANTADDQRVSILVLSSPTNTNSQPVRLSGTLILTEQSTSSSTLRLYAEATKGDNPVTGLEVTALVDLPDGTSQKVDLYDNGAGADIVENDGVYSRFFSKMTMPGLYTVRLTATGQATSPHKSSVDATANQQNIFVQRSVSAGYVVIRNSGNSSSAHVSTRSVSGSGSDIDTEAPVRISDLRVIKTSSKNRTVALSWRASGDDADRETASHYEVYMAPKALDLMKGTDRVTNLTQSDVVHGNLVAPKPFGSREYLMVRIPPTQSRTTRFVFTVVAVDKAGNKGAHSNYVTVGLGDDADDVPDMTDMTYWPDGNQQFLAEEEQTTPTKKENLVIATLLGTTTGLLVIVIIVTIIVSAVTEWRKRKAWRMDTTLPTTLTEAEIRSALRHSGRNSVTGSVLSRDVFALS